MKKSLRIIGLISISLLYCFAISVYSGIASNAGTAFSKQGGSSDESIKAAISAKSFHHTLQTENSVTVFNNTRPVSLKNAHKELSACIKVTEQLYCNTFLQYSFYSHKLLLRVQQTDLIFPFHDFW